MNALNLKFLLIGLALFVAAAVGVTLKPTKHTADQVPAIDLETMIPNKFREWNLDESIVPIKVSPDVQAKLNEIYVQTLSRTYVNMKGQRVMLSIAYGRDQSDSMQVHKPEVCYPSQGLPIIKNNDGLLKIQTGNIPVRRLVAQQDNRYEPITYWIRMGDVAAVGSLQQKLAKMTYTLTGKIPDGLLFRVSTVGMMDDESYRLQDTFVNDLLGSLDSRTFAFLVGKAVKG
jgi:EpsI family protein